ncbi:hypothetical protein JCM11491_005324 [Sporobolomyces phaffii]
MGIKGFWGRVTKLSLAKVSNSLDVIAHYLYKRLPLPPPARPPSPDPADVPEPAQHPAPDDPPPARDAKASIHFVAEVATLEHREKLALLASPAASSLPLLRFNQLLRFNVNVALRQEEDRIGLRFPGVFITWIYEGHSTDGKQSTLGARAKGDAKAQFKERLWATAEKATAARKRARRAKERQRKARRAAEKAAENDKGKGKGKEVEAHADELPVPMDVDEPSASREEAEQAAEGSISNSQSPRAKRSDRILGVDVPHLRAPMTVDFDARYPRDRQFRVVPSNRVRYVQAKGEGEHALAAATRADPGVDDKVEFVSYASNTVGRGRDFEHPPSRTICGSVDGDQVAIITEDEFAWSLHRARFGHDNYCRQQIESDDPDAPQPLPLPETKSRLIKCWRLVNLGDLFTSSNFFPQPTITCRAALIALIGNDYIPGGLRITFDTFAKGKHSELVEFISAPDLPTRYFDADQEQQEDLEKDFQKLKALLPQSPPISALTLPAFIKNRQKTLALGIEYVKKSDVVQEQLAAFKKELEDDRRKAKSLLERQTKQAFGPEAWPRNHPHLSPRHWPAPPELEVVDSRTPAEGEQSGGQAPVEADGSRPDREVGTPRPVNRDSDAFGSKGLGDDEEEEEEKEEEEEEEEKEEKKEENVSSTRVGVQSMQPARGQKGRQNLTIKRRELPNLHDRLQTAKGKIRIGHLEPPSDRPLLPMRVSTAAPGSSLDDLGAAFTTVQRRARSVYRDIAVVDESGTETRLKDAFVRFERATAQVICAEVEATARTWFRVLDHVGTSAPHLLMDVQFTHLWFSGRVMSAARARAQEIDDEDEEHEAVPPPTRRATRSTTTTDAAGQLVIDELSPKRVEWSELFRRAATSDEQATGEVYRGRNVHGRLQPSLSPLATASMQTWKARTKELQAVRILLESFFEDPNGVISRLHALTATLFPNLDLPNIPALSSSSARFLSGLVRNQPLLQASVDYVVHIQVPTWSPSERIDNIPAPDPLPKELEGRLDDALGNLGTRPRGLTRPELAALGSQAEIDKAMTTVTTVLGRLSTLLPRLVVDFAGTHVSQMTRAEGARGSKNLSPKEIADKVKRRDFLPTDYTFGALLDPKGGGRRCKEYYAVVRGTKLAILFLADRLRHSFAPQTAQFDTGTTYRWSHTPLHRARGQPIQPAIFVGLEDYVKNQQNGVKRVYEAVRAAGAPDVIAEENVSNESWIGGGEGGGGGGTSPESHSEPPHLARVRRTVDRLVNGRSRTSIENLAPIERSAYFAAMYPQQQILESLSGNPYLMPRTENDEVVVNDAGFIEFKVDFDLLQADADKIVSYYETILPGCAKANDRVGRLLALKPEVLTQRFKTDRPGVLVPRMYAITPNGVNITYQDPRYVEELPLAYSEPDSTRTIVDLVEQSVFDRAAYSHLKRGVVWEIVKERVQREKQEGDDSGSNPRAQAVHTTRLAPSFFDEKGKWLVGRDATRRPPSPHRPSTHHRSAGHVVAPEYSDPDHPTASIKKIDFNDDEERAAYEEDSQLNLKLLQYQLLGPLPPDVVRVVIANDAGQVCPGALVIYFPDHAEAWTDLLTRDRFVGSATTKQLVGKELSSVDGTKERDELCQPSRDKVNDGALGSIRAWNTENPEQVIPTSFGLPSRDSRALAHERRIADQSEMDALAAQQVNTALPDRDRRVYEVNLILGGQKLPKVGIVGPEKYSTYEKSLVNALKACPRVRLTIFHMSENFTSQHCPRCDLPTLFHPKSLDTQNRLHRVSLCWTCREAFHRDLLSAECQLLGAYLTALTGYHAYSPLHEVSIFGRSIEPREDGERLRLRGAELENRQQVESELWLSDQQEAFEPQDAAAARERI